MIDATSIGALVWCVGGVFEVTMSKSARAAECQALVAPADEYPGISRSNHDGSHGCGAGGSWSARPNNARRAAADAAAARQAQQEANRRPMSLREKAAQRKPVSASQDNTLRVSV